jgi:hypothetical protein
MLEIERNYDIMSNMKDYMMWLDDRGIAKWASVSTDSELIIPEGVDIYDEKLVNEYHNDGKWHRPELDGDDEREDMIEDEEDESDDLYDDDAGDELDLEHQMRLIKSLLDTLFNEEPTSIQFAATLELDTVSQLWNTRNTVAELLEYDNGESVWFDEEGGLTGDAQNYLHELDKNGELL